MARSKTSIMNMALDLVGASNIISPTDNTKAARAMNRAWQPTLDLLLEKHAWSFAIKRTGLAETVATPDYEYSHQFALPLGCLRPLDVWPKNVKWKREGAYVVCNASAIRLRYVSSIIDPNEFTETFSGLLALALAKQTCFKLSQNRAKTAELNEEFKKQFLWAASDDSKGAGTIEPFADDDWMIHRGYSSDNTNNAIVAEDFDYGSVN